MAATQGVELETGEPAERPAVVIAVGAGEGDRPAYAPPVAEQGVAGEEVLANQKAGRPAGVTRSGEELNGLVPYLYSGAVPQDNIRRAGQQLHVGLSHAANAAFIDGHENGMLTTGSIMAPAP